MSGRFLLLQHKPAPFIKDHPPSRKITSMHNCKLGRGTATSGGKGQLSAGEQRSGTRLEVTPVAQHWWGRETGWEEAGAGPGESTHPSHRALGTAAHHHTLQLRQSLLLLPHHSLPLERWNLRAAKTTKKSKTSSFSLSAFLLYEQT